MDNYSDIDIVEDINNAKELKRILNDEKVKSGDFKDKYTNDSMKLNRMLNIVLALGLLIPLLTGNLILTLTFFIPYGILKYRNDFKLNKFNYYCKLRDKVLNVSINNLDNLVDDLNTVLESRKGKEIEESKINNLIISLSIDNEFYDDLLKLDKSFSPNEVIISNNINEINYMPSEEYYNLIFDKLFVKDTKNEEEYKKLKKIKCNYLFDTSDFKNI